MSEGFNIKEGFLNLLKQLVHDEEFISLVIRLLLGRKDAPDALNAMFLNASYDQSLNEVVVAHRMFRAGLKEEFEPNNGKDKNLLRKIVRIQEKSMAFQRKVIIRALKKPGVAAALFKLMKTRGTDPKAWVVVAQAVVDAAVEVAQKEDEREVKSMVAESIEASYGGRMPVNVYVGRFQPFHLGHLSCVEAGAKRGLRTVICPVKPGKTAKSQANHYFGGDLEREMFDRVREAYRDLVADIIPVDSPAPQNWVEQIRERGMEPITWTTGEDQKPSYENMIMRYGPDFNLVDDFEVIGLPKNVGAGGGSANDKENIEGRAVRECLKNDDREGFMRQMPKCLWDMYDKMRSALVGEREPAAALSENTEYDDYRKWLDEAITKLVKGKK